MRRVQRNKFRRRSIRHHSCRKMAGRRLHDRQRCVFPLQRRGQIRQRTSWSVPRALISAQRDAPCMKSASCMPAPRWRYRRSCSRPRVRWSDAARRCCRENRGPGAHLPPRTFMRMPEKRTFMPPQKELSCATRYGPRRRRSTLQLYAPSPSRNVISFPTGDATALKLPV